MPARPVRRPHLDRHHARQPAAPVVRIDGLCAAVHLAPHRSGAHAVRLSHLPTIRLKLLKLGALVCLSVRRIKIAMASASPWKTLLRHRSRKRPHPIRQYEKCGLCAGIRPVEWRICGRVGIVRPQVMVLTPLPARLCGRHSSERYERALGSSTLRADIAEPIESR